MKNNQFLALFLVVLTSLFFTGSAFAHSRNFVWTYEWFTTPQGTPELELWYTAHPDKDKSVEQIELEYSVTDRWVVAPYFIYERYDDKANVKGWKFEQRYRFGNFSRYKILPSAYFEVKKLDGKSHKGELKLLLSYLTDDMIFALNLIAERNFAPHSKTEKAFSFGAAKRSGKKWTIGAEVKGEISTPEYYVGPTIGYQIDANQRIILGSQFGLSKASEDQMIRVIYEYEWK
ncbi:MAG: hypothetical protein PWR01_3990 [Clostridiales bacterium]|nr:hypothetical protein [Clostridiales bacterium]MDN5282917.1 hypothetical protein [Candidatus Ozemobacter sp.]